MIVVGAKKQAAGSIGYWEQKWQGESVWEADIEYPKGHFMRCNDWRLELLGGDSQQVIS